MPLPSFSWRIRNVGEKAFNGYLTFLLFPAILIIEIAVWSKISTKSAFRQILLGTLTGIALAVWYLGIAYAIFVLIQSRG